MVKPSMKVYLLLGGTALAVAAAVAAFLVVLQGGPHWGQVVVLVATAVLTFVAAALLWVAGARQIRVERAHGVKLVLRELESISAASKSEIAVLREDLDSVRDQGTALDDRQRKLLNVLRSEAHSVRGRLDALVETQQHQSKGIGDTQRSLVRVDDLRSDLDSVGTLVSRLVSMVDVMESRERKLLNLLRGEIRDSEARSEEMKRALTVQGDKAAKAASRVEDANISVKKMHNFLRRDGSIQIALDRFTAAERRMLAAVETSGLDHADQLAALTARIEADREEDHSDLTRLGGEVHSGLLEFRSGLDSNMSKLETEFNDLRERVSEMALGEERRDEALNQRSDRLSANIDVRLRGVGEQLAELKELYDGEDLSAISESSRAVHEDEPAADGGPLLLSEITQAHTSVSKAVVRAQTGRLERFFKRQSIDIVRQVEALMQLVPRVESTLRRYPPSGWWALPADTLLFLSDYVEKERPRRILEVGSGASTVWIGTFAKKIGAELVSLEHDFDYVQKTRGLVDEYELQDVATVHHAPLRSVDLDEGSFNWYDPEVVAELEGPFDVLIVDGPPEATGDKARKPALPLLEHLLADTCLVLLDDTHRPDETEILKEWVEAISGFEPIHADLMRTGAIRRRRRTAGP